MASPAIATAKKESELGFWDKGIIDVKSVDTKGRKIFSEMLAPSTRGMPKLLADLEANIRSKYDPAFMFSSETVKFMAEKTAKMEFKSFSFYETVEKRGLEGARRVAGWYDGNVNLKRTFDTRIYISKVVAHEIIHGMVRKNYQGVLNEAFADVMAQVALGHSDYNPSSWKIGYRFAENSAVVSLRKFFEENPKDAGKFADWYFHPRPPIETSLKALTRLTCFMAENDPNYRKPGFEWFFNSLFLLPKEFESELGKKNTDKLRELIIDSFGGAKGAEKPDARMQKLKDELEKSPGYPYFDAGVYSKLGKVADFLKKQDSLSKDEQESCSEFIKAYQKAIVSGVKPKKISITYETLNQKQ